MSDQEEQLFNEMEASNAYLKETLDQFQEKIDRLEDQDTLRLANRILDNNRVFRYLSVIGYLLKRTASLSVDFFSVLKKAIEKTNGDMAQPTLVNDLIDIGLNDPELGLDIYKKAKELKDIELFLLAGVFLQELASKITTSSARLSYKT
jgi:hypothetical protein